MNQAIQVKPHGDHALQWAALKRLYVAQRKSDAGRNRLAIPRTTNADVKQLTTYWHGEYLREVVAKPLALDKDLASRKRWIEHKRTLDSQLARADPNAVYAANEWFWQDATRGLAIYLESRKAVPSRAELVIGIVREQVDAARKLVKDTIDEVTPDLWPAIKTGLWIVGGLAGAAIVIPPIVRAFKD